MATNAEAAVGVLDSLERNYASNPGVPYVFHPFTGPRLEYIHLDMSGQSYNTPIFSEPIYICYDGDVPEAAAAVGASRGVDVYPCDWDTNGSTTVIGSDVAGPMHLSKFGEADEESYTGYGGQKLAVFEAFINVKLTFKTRSNGQVSVVLPSVILGGDESTVIGYDVTLCLCHAYCAHPNDMHGRYWMYDTQIHGKTVDAGPILKQIEEVLKMEKDKNEDENIDKKEDENIIANGKNDSNDSNIDSNNNTSNDKNNDKNEKYKHGRHRQMKKLPRSMTTPRGLWMSQIMLKLHPFRFFNKEYYQAIQYMQKYSKYYPKIPKEFDCMKFFSQEQKDLVKQWEHEQTDRILAYICQTAKNKMKADKTIV